MQVMHSIVFATSNIAATLKLASIAFATSNVAAAIILALQVALHCYK